MVPVESQHYNVKCKKVIRPERICKDCGEKTTNYYPIFKSKLDEVRCEECQVRYLRSNN